MNIAQRARRKLKHIPSLWRIAGLNTDFTDPNPENKQGYAQPAKEELAEILKAIEQCRPLYKEVLKAKYVSPGEKKRREVLAETGMNAANYNYRELQAVKEFARHYRGGVLLELEEQGSA